MLCVQPPTSNDIDDSADNGYEKACQCARSHCEVGGEIVSLVCDSPLSCDESRYQEENFTTTELGKIASDLSLERTVRRAKCRLLSI